MLTKNFTPAERTELEWHLRYLKAHLGGEGTCGNVGKKTVSGGTHTCQKDMDPAQVARYLKFFAERLCKSRCSPTCKGNHINIATQTHEVDGAPISAMRVFHVTNDGNFEVWKGMGEGTEFVGPKIEEPITPEEIVKAIPTDMLIKGIEAALFSLMVSEEVNMVGLFTSNPEVNEARA